MFDLTPEPRWKWRVPNINGFLITHAVAQNKFAA